MSDTGYVSPTITNLPKPAATLEELAEQADRIVRAAQRMPSLDVVRAMFNETGIRRARGVLTDAPDVLGNALEALRVAQEAERFARQAHDEAVLEGEWSLGDSFVQDGRDTYLVIGEGIQQQRKKLLAAEKAAYVAAAVAKMPAVAKTADALHQATEAAAQARDAVEVAKARLSAARHDLDASIAELQALTLAIPTSLKENA